MVATRRSLPAWEWAILCVAALKAGTGACLQLAVWLGAITEPALSHAAPMTPALLAAFASVGAVLIANRGRDARAGHLGGIFLLVAASAADSVLYPIASRTGAWQLVAVLLHLHPDVFLPLVSWLFFRDFPHTEGPQRWDWVPRLAVRVTAVVGTMLFVWLAAPLLGWVSGPTWAPLPAPGTDDRVWLLLLSLSSPSLIYSAWRIGNAPVAERRRARLFVGGFLLGTVPVLLVILLEALVPAFTRLMLDPAGSRRVALVLGPFLLSVPVTTAYAVLVQRALDVRLVLRQALQYALARYTLVAVAAVPFCALLHYFYTQRQQTLSHFFSGPRPVALLAAVAVCVLGLYLNRRALELVDRRFFREHYDAQLILGTLVERSRRVASAEELAALLEREIDRALHLESALVLLRNRDNDLVAPAGARRRLAAASSLLTMAASHAAPLDLDLGRGGSSVARLSAADREWIEQGAVRLLVPLLSTDGTLLGLIALGAKRSDLDFSKEDRLLLVAIAAASALTLENRMMLSSPGITATVAGGTGPDDPLRTPDPSEGPADHCNHCQLLQRPGSPACEACGGPLLPAAVPLVLNGKFRLELRLGAGGMGVVYRAVDLSLGRMVAIKTLPRVDPEAALRLRREARAMAAVSHPNLALIHGAETWRRTPMLVFEYLDGGTLAERIWRGRLPALDVVELGITLAAALGQLHGTGILHRDVKPSNIGFTARGVPKLMDFGLAKILDDLRDTGAGHGTAVPFDQRDTASLPGSTQVTITEAGHIVGTPAYFSPDVLRGDPPSPALDLWALGVVMFEAIMGRHPFLGATVADTVSRIRATRLPAMESVLGTAGTPVEQMFGEVLAPDPERRPATAAALAGRLTRLHGELAR